MFQTKDVEEIKTRILCSVTFFRKSCHLSDKVENYCRAVQATDDRHYGACALHVGYLRLHTHTHTHIHTHTHTHTHTHSQYIILTNLPLQ